MDLWISDPWILGPWICGSVDQWVRGSVIRGFVGPWILGPWISVTPVSSSGGGGVVVGDFNTSSQQLRLLNHLLKFKGQ